MPSWTPRSASRRASSWPSLGRPARANPRLCTCSAFSIRRRRAEKIGFVFQAFNLLPRLTVSGNVRLPLTYHRHPPADSAARVADALARVDMTNRAHHRPGELSGGQRQRVAIARALVNSPRILLADEPTGNLDTHTAATILALFKELNRQGGTIVLVTHSAEIAAQFPRQLHVRDGRITDHR
jgi:ABC-type lipoprotein export system ATPase subunit